MNNATYPETYRRSQDAFIVMRTEAMKTEHKTLLSVASQHHITSLWLTDDQVNTLAEMLRDAHDTSKPLFVDQS